MLKIMVVVWLATLAVVIYLALNATNGDLARHNLAMHEEHQQLHVEHNAIMAKAVENGNKLDMLLKIATNQCFYADK